MVYLPSLLQSLIVFKIVKHPFHTIKFICPTWWDAFLFVGRSNAAEVKDYLGYDLVLVVILGSGARACVARDLKMSL